MKRGSSDKEVKLPRPRGLPVLAMDVEKRGDSCFCHQVVKTDDSTASARPTKNKRQIDAGSQEAAGPLICQMEAVYQGSTTTRCGHQGSLCSRGRQQIILREILGGPPSIPPSSHLATQTGPINKSRHPPKDGPKDGHLAAQSSQPRAPNQAPSRFGRWLSTPSAKRLLTAFQASTATT
ncbi:hypothetical protein G6O67_006202 [Ophiocordyceps sinensis]|uniref:Uncharacterized protein n=1 Tax=Ophiocordyceps sinensis TaxID=72228 RepID=A0A8H4LVW1_9HYPO|nr:hypothetical protein G6O67_006202 [Ophiocordyceps sinensis]